MTSRVVGKVSMFDVRMPGIGQAQWKKQWDNQDGKSGVQYMFLFVSSIAKVIRRLHIVGCRDQGYVSCVGRASICSSLFQALP